MNWIEKLHQELGDDSLEITDEKSFLLDIIRGLIRPEPSFEENGKLSFPEGFHVKMGGSNNLCKILAHPQYFELLPVNYQKTLLDILLLIVQRDPYQIVKLQFCEELFSDSEKYGLCKILIRLLGSTIANKGSESVSRRLVHLIGIIAGVGISAHDLRKMLLLLRAPTNLTIPLLQSLNRMFKTDAGTTKVAPPSFFNFGGGGSGLYTSVPSFPFTKEYQFCTWFRVSAFENEQVFDATHISHVNRHNERTQHLISWNNPSHKGMDLYIENRKLVLAYNNTSKAEPTIIQIEKIELKIGVWYHLSVKHTKAKMSFFSNDELSITLDYNVIYTDNAKFPNLGNLVDTDFIIGRNLEGQMGPIYFFNEAISQAAMMAIAKVDSGRGYDSYNASSEGSPADLLKAVVSFDKKTHPIQPKVCMTYHPSRCYNGYALDIHGGRHARLGAFTQPWDIVNAREHLVTMGGISCILPLFPRLLVEQTVEPTGNSFESLNKPHLLSNSTSSNSILNALSKQGPEGSVLSDALQQQLRIYLQDFEGDGYLSLLISMVARCIVKHKAYQQQFITIGGVYMIEYALSCVPKELFTAEGEKCVLALQEFKCAAVEFPTLELAITKTLLCNIKLWYHSTFPFMLSLMSVVLATMKAQPETFLKLLGVKTLLDYLDLFKTIRNDEKAEAILRKESSSSVTFMSPLPTSPSPTELDTFNQELSKESDRHVVTFEHLEESESVSQTDSNSTITTPKHSIASSTLASSTIGRSARSRRSFYAALSETMIENEADSRGITQYDDSLGRLESITKAADDSMNVSVDEPTTPARGLTILHPNDENFFSNDIQATPFSAPSTSTIPTPLITPNSQVAAERKQIRDYLECMIVALIKQGSSEKEIMPVIDYLCTCKDQYVLNEIANILLYLIIEGDSKIISSIIIACNGPEEFASFVLLYLIHQPYEELRCTGIRILTYFYLKVDQVASLITSLSNKKEGKQNIFRALNKFASGNNNLGMQRLHACGGLSLLCELVTAHCKVSSEITYAALLELLLTKPNSSGQIAIQLKHAINDYSINLGSNQSTVIRSASTSNNSMNAHGGGGGIARNGLGSATTLLFATDYLALDALHDEGLDMINSLVLPIFFQVLPKFSIQIHELIYTDLLALLKHSLNHRQAFCMCPSWHLCMYEMVSKLIPKTTQSTIQEIKDDLDAMNTLDHQEKSTSDILNDLEKGILQSSYSFVKGKKPSSQLDLWFDIGMKIYATLLLHAIEYKHGWKEIDQSISPSFNVHTTQSDNKWDDEENATPPNVGYMIAQTILSHVLNEMVFNMKSKYKELQKLAKSNNIQENQLAADKLENILSIMLTSSQIALFNEQCVLNNILTEYDVCKLRLSIYQKLLSSEKYQNLIDSDNLKQQLFDEVESLLLKEISILSYEDLMKYKDQIEEMNAGGLQNATPFGTTAATTTGNGVQKTKVHCSEFLNFDHTWIEIVFGHETSAPSTPTGDSVPMASRSYSRSVTESDGNANTIFFTANASNAKSIEEILHPLDRVHHIEDGKLILILQTLRFFDVIFWPNQESILIRNHEMLRFSKETLQSLLLNPSGGSAQSMNNNNNSVASPESNLNITINNSNATTSSVDSNPKRPENQRKQITIFSSVMRMCMYTLNHLSPCNDLAISNMKRLRALLLTLDKVSSYNTPIHDWLLVSYHYLLIHIQRCIPLISKIYTSVLFFPQEITQYVNTIRSIGNWEFPYDKKSYMQNIFKQFDHIITSSRVQSEETSMSSEILTNIFNYFNNPAGYAVIKNIFHSFNCMINVFEYHHDLLERLYDETYFHELYYAIEQMKLDINLAFANQLDICMLSMLLIPTASSNNMPNMMSPPTASPAQRSFRKNTRTSSTDRPRASFDSNANSPLGGTNDNTNNDSGNAYSYNMRGRSFSEYSDNSSNSANPADADPYFTTTTNTAATDGIDPFAGQEAFTALDILYLLKWLLFPVFHMNPYRNITLLQALEALDYMESRAIYRFSWETQLIKQELEHYQDVNLQAIAEMTELKDLSRELYVDIILPRIRSNSQTINLYEHLKLKKVVITWHQCLEMFESSWSVWKSNVEIQYPSLEEKEEEEDNRTSSNDGIIMAPKPKGAIAGVSTHELGKYSDRKYRRLLLSRLSEPRDHRDAAYFEVKLKDQWEYLNSTNQLDDAHAILPTPHTSVNVAKMNLPYRVTSLKPKDETNNAWDDQDWDSEEELNGSASVNSSDAGSADAGLSSGIVEVSKSIASFIQNNIPIPNNSVLGRPHWTYLFQWAADEKMLFISDANQIEVEQTLLSTVVVTNKCIYIHSKKRLKGLANPNDEVDLRSRNNSDKNATADSNMYVTDQRFYLDRLFEAYGRRYLLQNCAIELFFVDAKEVFLAFNSLGELSKFFRILKQPHYTPQLITPRSLNPRYVYKNSSWTELWKKRLISNFDYLMKLNMMAGRSFNDITQYPVFPWVIADYSSSTLDLQALTSYRPLGKPIGALNPTRLQEFLDRYKSFDEATIPKFMYGSHYSSAGVVLHFLIRQEPFTTLAIHLQSGRFDCPDRIFFDLSKTWNGCNNSMSDVKELIPEMFFLPEMFINQHQLPLGELQSGSVVDHVNLPIWCQKSPYEFIRINREALESDYVSEHLHEWVDLIFGYKQTGPAAVQANNVFYYLTYENSIDISSIQDPLQRAATKAQVTHFGQTPSQLLQKAHPKRMSREEYVPSLCFDRSRITCIQMFTPHVAKINGKGYGPVIGMACSVDKLIVVHESLMVSYYKWTAFPDPEGSPFTIKYDKNKLLLSNTYSMSEKLMKDLHSIQPMLSAHHHHSEKLTVSASSSSVDYSHGQDDSAEHHTASNTAATTPEKRESNTSTTSTSSSHSMSASSVTSAGGNNTTPPPSSSGGGTLFGNWRSFGGFGAKRANPPTAASTTSIHGGDMSHTNTTTGTANTSPGASTSLYNAVRLEQKKHRSHPVLHSTTTTTTGTTTTISATDSTTTATTATTTATATTHRTQHHSLHTRASMGNNNNSNNITSSPVKRNPHHTFQYYTASSFPPLHDMNHKYISIFLPDSLSQGRIVSCGYWDNAIKVHTIDTMKEVVSCASGHIGGVTCLQQGNHGMGNSPGNGNIVLTGGMDGMIRVWVLEKPSLVLALTADIFYAEPLLHDELMNQNLAANEMNALYNLSSSNNSSSGNNNPPSLICIHTLCGHNDAPITAVYYQYELDIIVSGDTKGMLCIHSMRTGQYIRSMKSMAGGSIDLLLVTSAGYIVAHSWQTKQYCLFWINGQLLLHTVVPERIECMISAGMSNIIVCGTMSGKVSFREVWSLHEVYVIDIEMYGAVKSLLFSEDQQFLFVGSEDGTYSVATDPEMRWKLLNAAVQKTPLLGTAM